jgi:outer membrane protein, heavy metal efflux system
MLQSPQEIDSGLPPLTEEKLVQDVLASNPTIAQMHAASAAAAARCPQVLSLDDPTLSVGVAPASFGSSSVDAGYRIEVAQKLDLFGKRDLRGQAAVASASAAESDAENARTQLVETARLVFCDYYLVERAIEVNNESLQMLQTFRTDAEARYKADKVPHQDVLQADVEIGRQQERNLILARQRQSAIARLNALLNRAPDAGLPPPPRVLVRGDRVPPVDHLRQLAISRRPDLHALQERAQAAEANVCLARKEFLPDVEVAAAYDTIVGNGPLRDLAPQVGLRVNLPFGQAKRHAMVAEAQAQATALQAELAALTTKVNFDVQEAFNEMGESAKVLSLYERTVLPAARANVQAAESAYGVGKASFMSLLDAQRNVVHILERYHEATADYYRRRAKLEHAVGGPMVLIDAGTPSPAQAAQPLMKKGF